MMHKFGLYNLIIVDDEKQIRDGLSQIVDWNSVGFEVAGVFADGREALEFLKENSVDVILTDIRMRHISGLELAEHVWRSSLQTKVVLLTGYKDFEYAKSACEYGVSYYLLKPTVLPELYDTFRKLKEQIDKDKRDKANIKQLLNAHSEQFFADFYFGAFQDGDALRKRIQLLNLEELFNACFTVIEVKIENYDKVNKHGYGKEQIYKAMRHFLEMRFPEFSFAVPYQEADRIIYIAYGSGVLDGGIWNEVSEEITDTIELCVSIKTDGTYGDIYEMERARRRHPATGELTALKQLMERQKLLFSYLFSNQQEEAVALFATLFQSLSSMDVETVHGYMQNLFSLLSKQIADVGVICENELFEIPAPNACMEAIERECTDKLARIARTMGIHSRNTENITISRAKEYIMENYGRDILLEDVANHVFLSPAYLSRIFKKYVGESFSGYLFSLRMNKAKALLRNSNLKVYEISEKVGIQTPKYFFKLFKDYTGLTPSEYRARAESTEEDL